MCSLNHPGPLPWAALCILNEEAEPWPSPKNSVLISGCRRRATGVLKLHLTGACQALQAVTFLLPHCPRDCLIAFLKLLPLISVPLL